MTNVEPPTEKAFPPTVSVEAWVNLNPEAPATFLPVVARWDGSYELDVNAGAGGGKANFVTRNDTNAIAIPWLRP